MKNSNFMNFYIRPITLLKKVDALKILTEDDFKKAAEMQEAGSCFRIPIQITLDSNGKFISAVRLEREFDALETGRNYTLTDDTVTLDGLISPVNKDDCIPVIGRSRGKMAYVQVAPPHTPNGIDGYVMEAFRLKSAYIPLCIGTHLYNTLQTFDRGIATVDVETQKVTKFEHGYSDVFDDDRYLGTQFDSVEKGTIRVAATIANGGFNFSRLVR